MINSRRIDDLVPAVRRRAHAFIAACDAVGIDVLITSTYRDLESQAALFAQGRSAPGQVVTNARPGESWHNWRCAFDFVPIVSGKAMWGDAALFRRCGVIAEVQGLEWAGRWRSFPELAHCQFTGGLSLVELRAGRQIPIDA